MALEKVTDSNYRDFIKGDRVVLLLTLSCCPHCHHYKHEIEHVIKSNPKVVFGDAEIDKPGVDEIERNIKMPDYFPTAILFSKGKELCRLESNAGDPTTKEELESKIKKHF